MAALHEQKLAHRDIKPGNVLLDGKMVAKIADFSFVCRLDGDLHKTWCGTRPYKSPEIIKHEPYDPLMADAWGMLLSASFHAEARFKR